MRLSEVLNKNKKLPDNKYQHFISEFGKSREFLLSHFLRDTKFDKTDYMPMSKGQINYVRWYRLLDSETGQYRTIMRNPSKPIVNFYYLNDLIHLFLYAGSGNKSEEEATYGHYDYKDGKLRYKISYKDPLKRNADGTYYDGNGHLHRIKGTGDINISSTKSTKGIYSPMSGIHQKQYKFGDRFNQYFQPEATIYNAKGDAVGSTRIKATDQIQHYLFPVSDIKDEDKLEQDVRTLISSIYSNFNGNSEESQKSYALFLAFLLGEYNKEFHEFDTWKAYASRSVDLWRSIIKHDAEKVIDEFEKEYQDKKYQAPRPNLITYKPHEPRDPEPINSTPAQAEQVRKWLDMYDGKEVDESRIRKEVFITESQFKRLFCENQYGKQFDDAINEYMSFFKQKSEEYGTEGWYNSGYMKMFKPNVHVNPADIEKLRELDNKKTEISKLWNQVNDEENAISRKQEQDEAVRGEKLLKWAIERFGITYSLGKAGYILPDGRLLDFSGGGDDRGTDHRAIEGIYKSNNIPIWDDSYRYNYVVDFLNQGAIRCDFPSGSLDMTREPSIGAFRAIKEFVRKADDISIDFTNGNSGDTDHSVYYDNPSPSRIVADIKRYYEEGIKPLGDE